MTGVLFFNATHQRISMQIIGLGEDISHEHILTCKLSRRGIFSENKFVIMKELMNNNAK